MITFFRETNRLVSADRTKYMRVFPYFSLSTVNFRFRFPNHFFRSGFRFNLNLNIGTFISDVSATSFSKLNNISRSLIYEQDGSISYLQAVGFAPGAAVH